MTSNNHPGSLPSPEWDSRDRAVQLARLKAAAVEVLNNPLVRVGFEELIGSPVFFTCCNDLPEPQPVTHHNPKRSKPRSPSACKSQRKRSNDIENRL